MTRYRTDIQRLLDRRGNLNARDGAIIDPVVDESNGTQWFFKYKKFTPGKYKWFAVGRQEDIIVQTGTALTPTPINTDVITGAAVTVPFSGMYFPRVTGSWNSSALSTVQLEVFRNGVAPALWQAKFAFVASQPFWYRDDEPELPIEFFAQQFIQVGAQCSVLGPSLLDHSLKVRPLRVNV